MSASEENDNPVSPEETTSDPVSGEAAPATEADAAEGTEEAEDEAASEGAAQQEIPATPAEVIAKIEREQLKAEVTPFGVGDTVKVHTRVIEGGKERIQIFAGIVIARNGGGLNEAFTVRKISYGEGVERVFPVHSPKVARVEVSRRGKVRRAKLHYLRDRVGKQATAVKAAD